MKIETSDAVTIPAFAPVSITITIESAEELAAFGIKSFDLDGMNDVWKVINNIAIKRGLKQ